MAQLENQPEEKKEKEKEPKKPKSANYGKILLMKHYKDLSKNSDGFIVSLVDDDNLYEWEIIINGPTETPYEGGMFRARLTFPQEFPNKPPTMTFTTPGFWHPNGTSLFSFLFSLFSFFFSH